MKFKIIQATLFLGFLSLGACGGEGKKIDAGCSDAQSLCNIPNVDPAESVQSEWKLTGVITSLDDADICASLGFNKDDTLDFSTISISADSCSLADTSVTDVTVECKAGEEQVGVVYDSTFSDEAGCTSTSHAEIVSAMNADTGKLEGTFTATSELSGDCGEEFDTPVSCAFEGTIGGEVPVADVDTDGDGIPDSEDSCPNDATNTCGDPVVDVDTDGDGVLDTDDNCPNKANADQADNDNDDEGNVCDSTPDGNGDGDADNDGLCETASICGDNIDPDPSEINFWYWVDSVTGQPLDTRTAPHKYVAGSASNDGSERTVNGVLSVFNATTDSVYSYCSGYRGTLVGICIEK